MLSSGFFNLESGMQGRVKICEGKNIGMVLDEDIHECCREISNKSVLPYLFWKNIPRLFFSYKMRFTMCVFETKRNLIYIEKQSNSK